jgi:hydrogenase-4 component E
MEANWMMGLFAAEVISAIFAAELRNLKYAIFALALQSLLLVAAISGFGYLSSSSHLYWWAVTAFIAKVLIIPLLLWVYIRKMPTPEVKPMIGIIPSIVIMAIILPITYYYTLNHLYPYFAGYLPVAYEDIADTVRVSVGLGFMMLALGIYVLLIRRDIIKVVIGLVIIENGIHQIVVSLAPTLDEASEIGIAFNLLIASWLLLYLAKNIYKLWGTKDTTSLSELKW